MLDPPHSQTISQRLTVSTRRRRSLISLTPLIDVVFILLVFFLLGSSYLDWRSIQLVPPATARASLPPEPRMMLVEIRPDGLRLSAEPVSPDVLVDRLQPHLRRFPDLLVLVQPTHGVTLQETVHLLDALSAAGVARLSLIRHSDKRVGHAL